jgi:hypothetical protein
VGAGAVVLVVGAIVLVDVAGEVVVVFGIDVVVVGFGVVVVGVVVGVVGVVVGVVVGLGATDVAAASVFGSAEPPHDDNVSTVTSAPAAIAPSAQDEECRPPARLENIAFIMTANHRRLRSLA